MMSLPSLQRILMFSTSCVEYPCLLASCSSCVSFDCDSAISLILLPVQEESAIEVCGLLLVDVVDQGVLAPNTMLTLDGLQTFWKCLGERHLLEGLSQMFPLK